MTPVKRQLLWVGSAPPRADLTDALAQRWLVHHVPAEGPWEDEVDHSAVVIHAAGTNGQSGRTERLLADLWARGVVPVVLNGHVPPAGAGAGGNARAIHLARDAAPGEVLAALAAADALAPALRDLHTQLREARNLRHREAQTLREFDEEMRLAGRLQRDFLPHALPEIDGVRFGVLFRPVAAVSGDIYDVTRLDETHVGFYVADATGHGMPAALLTMFIKKALQTKHITGHTYEIVPPTESLAQLNEDMCAQDLSSCDFCTAVYGVIDAAAHAVTLARAGHPEPLLLRREGNVEVIRPQGPLLGVLRHQTFQPCTVTLDPGDRLVVYSDGIEDALCPPDAAPGDLANVARSWVGRPREQLLADLAAQLDAQPPTDDVTVLILDVEDPA